VRQNTNNTTILSLYLALVDKDMFDHVQQVAPARGNPYNVHDRNFGLVERAIRIANRLCSA
jgi:hypothetical protein